jgi:hypothetical protein
MDQFKYERRVSLFTAVVVVGFVMFLVVRDKPFSDPNYVVLTRIILAVAAACLGATIPGVLSVKYNAEGLGIRGTGALALFLIVY